MVSPHGTKGEVSVAPLRGLPFLLRDGMTVALTPPSLSRDRFCTVERVNDQASLVAFSGIDNLDRAESIAGCYVLAREDELELGVLELPFDDLIGREVHDERYGALGKIVEVLETPANNVWVIEGDSYGEVLIPAIEQVVLDLPDEGGIRVRIMDGLIDCAAPTGEDA